MTALQPTTTSAEKPSSAASKVSGSCSNCKAVIAQFSNSWTQITRTYFLENDRDGETKSTLHSRGNTIIASINQQALKNCLLQPLACHCDEFVAFRCLKAPTEKVHFKDRDFYKLSKVELFDSRGEIAKPVVTTTLAGAEQSGVRAPTESQSRSPAIAGSPPQSSFPERMTTPDRQAVQGTNDGSLDWQEAHENWTRASGVTLSPSAFAKRILHFGGGSSLKRKPSPPLHRNGEDQSRSAPPVIDRERVPPQSTVHAGEQAPDRQPEARSTPLHAPTTTLNPNLRPTDSGNAGNHEANTPQHNPIRWAGHNPAPVYVAPQTQPPSQSGPNPPWPATQQPYYPPPPHSYPPFTWVGPAQPQYPPAGTGFDNHARDILELKSHVKELMASMRNLTTAIESIRKDMGRVPASESDIDVLSDTVAGFAAKTGQIDGIVLQMDVLRRKVNRLENSKADGHRSPSSLRGPGVSSEERTDSPMTTTHEAVHTGLDGQRAQTLTNGFKRAADSMLSHPSKRSRTRTESELQQSSSQLGVTPLTDWQSQAPTMVTYGGDVSRTSRRGRPPKWIRAEYDRESPGLIGYSWAETQADAAAGPQYRAIAPADRGRIARRGMSWDMTNLLRRTRRKPTRDEHGNLLRSDGTIDRRSVTSAKNLKKRKEVMQQTEAFPPPSNTKSNTLGISEPPQAQTRPALSEALTDRDLPAGMAHESHANDKHARTLQRMFPNGIADDTNRVNHAARLFSSNSPEKPKAMLPRGEMVKADHLQSESVETPQVVRQAQGDHASSLPSPKTSPELMGDIQLIRSTQSAKPDSTAGEAARDSKMPGEPTAAV